MLSESERESVDAWWESEWPEENVDVLDTLAATVQQIADARADAAVRAALEAAVNEIERQSCCNACDMCNSKFVEGAEFAASIVRAAIPKPSQPPEDRPLCPPAER
jgi:Tfp pilus assembly PilM family ATPase